MRNTLLSAVFIFFAVLATGCAGWSTSGGLYEDRDNHYSVTLPEGWFMNDRGHALFLTKEGPGLQYIFVQTTPIGKPIIYSRKTLYSGMTGLEMAEYFLENNSFDQRMGSLKAGEISTGNVLGYPGFKMEGTYENIDGLTHAFTYYGFMTPKLYYGVSYSAPRRVYYEKDFGVFNMFFATFKVIEE